MIGKRVREKIWSIRDISFGADASGSFYVSFRMLFHTSKFSVWWPCILCGKPKLTNHPWNLNISQVKPFDLTKKEYKIFQRLPGVGSYRLNNDRLKSYLGPSGWEALEAALVAHELERT